MFRFSIGDTRVTRIPESLAPAAEPYGFLPDLPPDAIDRHGSWLSPVFYDGGVNRLVLSGHGWLVRTARSNILIEACAGNHKERPTFPRGHRLNTPWLEQLAAAGCAPEDIDFVLCTHLHVDHVGWFTRQIDGAWTPTFANARYLIDRLEYANWNPATRTLPALGINANSFEDSVAPVMAAGQMILIDEGHTVEPRVTVVPARGHTLGHVIIRVENSGASALFTGDSFHSPLQIVYPHCVTYACEDKRAAIATHHRILAECADQGRLFVPTHFPEPYSAVSIHRRGNGYVFAGLDGIVPMDEK